MKKKLLVYSLLWIASAHAAPPEEAPLEDLPDPSAESTTVSPDASASAETPSVTPPVVTASPAPAVTATAPEAIDPDSEPEYIMPTDEEKRAGHTAPALSTTSQTYASDGEPGSALEPTEQFRRVPLRPQMSDVNWRKWAGPALEKNYRIHRGDTLWGVSERLFGNPFLWPKVWQLNALLSNPNIVPKGLEMQFLPGNPNSAPELAFQQAEGMSSDELPVMVTSHQTTLMDLLDETLRAQNSLTGPPFKYFLASEKPEVFAKVQLLKNKERIYLEAGDFFAADCADGTYAIVRILPMVGSGSAYRVRWLGNAEVHDEQARVTQAYNEIERGDLLVKRNFTLSPLALHEETIPKDGAHFVALEEGAEVFTSEMRLIGAEFRSREAGPRPGAIVEVKRAGDRVARLLLLNRDKNYGTFWIIDNKRELSIAGDQFGK